MLFSFCQNEQGARARDEVKRWQFDDYVLLAVYFKKIFWNLKLSFDTKLEILFKTSSTTTNRVLLSKVDFCLVRTPRVRLDDRIFNNTPYHNNVQHFFRIKRPSK